MLKNLGYEKRLIDLQKASSPLPIEAPHKIMVVPSWEDLCLEAERSIGYGCELEDIFTSEELKSNELAIKQLNEEYNVLHRLDKYDIVNEGCRTSNIVYCTFFPSPL